MSRLFRAVSVASLLVVWALGLRVAYHVGFFDGVRERDEQHQKAQRRARRKVRRSTLGDRLE